MNYPDTYPFVYPSESINFAHIDMMDQLWISLHERQYFSGIITTMPKTLKQRKAEGKDINFQSLGFYNYMIGGIIDLMTRRRWVDEDYDFETYNLEDYKTTRGIFFFNVARLRDKIENLYSLVRYAVNTPGILDDRTDTNYNPSRINPGTQLMQDNDIIGSFTFEDMIDILKLMKSFITCTSGDHWVTQAGNIVIGGNMPNFYATQETSITPPYMGTEYTTLQQAIDASCATYAATTPTVFAYQQNLGMTYGTPNQTRLVLERNVSNSRIRLATLDRRFQTVKFKPFWVDVSGYSDRPYYLKVYSVERERLQIFYKPSSGRPSIVVMGDPTVILNDYGWVEGELIFNTPGSPPDVLTCPAAYHDLAGILADSDVSSFVANYGVTVETGTSLQRPVMPFAIITPYYTYQ
jgi:hypothetical protein